MKTRASFEAYINETNCDHRIKNKELIIEAYKYFGAMSIRQLAERCGLNYRQCQPRVSELYEDGRLKVVNEVREGNQFNSVFEYNPVLFGVKNLSFTAWVKKNYPQTYVEYCKIYGK